MVRKMGGEYGRGLAQRIARVLEDGRIMAAKAPGLTVHHDMSAS